MWRAAAIGGPFFVRSFLGERFAKPTNLCHNPSPSCVSARRSSNANRLCGQNSAGSEYLPRRRAAEERAAETG